MADENISTGKLIARKADEQYLDTVARALSSPFTAPQFADSASTDYHRIDISEFMLVAATENTPLSVRLGRVEGARALKHEWLEQYLSGPTSGAISVLAETSDPSASVAKVPTRYDNYMNKIGKLFVMSDEAQVIARANGLIAVGAEEMARQLTMLGQDLIRDQERLILEGNYSASSPRQMRGILGDYRNTTANGWIGSAGVFTGSTLNYAAAQITSANIATVLDTFLLQMYNLYAGPLPTTLYVPAAMAKLVVDAATSKIQIVMTQDELFRRSALNLGGAIGRFYTSFGFLDLVAHPLLSAATSAPGAGTSRMLALHEPSIKLVDYVGYGGIHMEPRAKTGPTETRLMSELFTLEVRNIKSHGVIENFYI